MKYSFTLVICMLLLQQNLAAQDTAFDATGIIKEHTIPKLIARHFAFTEGPAVDCNGNIFFYRPTKKQDLEI